MSRARLRLVVALTMSLGGVAQAEYDAHGLFIAPGGEWVAAHCTVCHSAKLIIQQGASYEGWRDIIESMQDEQGLWEIPPAQLEAMLDYLAAHYGEERPHWGGGVAQ